MRRVISLHASHNKSIASEVCGAKLECTTFVTEANVHSTIVWPLIIVNSID